jgi:DNA-binding NarL/FixJ family response regulator
MDRINILLADDQMLMSVGLQTIICLEQDMDVVAIATNGQEAYEMVGRFRPNLVLMDIRMPVMNGIESLTLIKRDYPETAVLMLTTHAEEEYIVDSFANGACGYMLKDIDGEALIASIRSAVKGQFVLPAVVAGKLATMLQRLSAIAQKEQAVKQLKDKAMELSEREKDIAKLLVENSSNSQIASKLHISEGTVKNYISTIYTKIGISNRAKAIAFLRELDGSH